MMEGADSKFPEVISSFDRFYNHYTSVCRERDEFSEKISVYTTENERLANSNESLQRDLKDMHEMVGKFNQQVTQIDTLNECNKVLKDECATLEQDMKERDRQYEDNLRKRESEHEEKLTSLIKSKEKDAETERQRMSDLVDRKNAEISQLRESIANAKKEKENEITVLSMEYENKLAKVQRQKSQLLQNNQQAANQDIFRKKLQHMKRTHEEEVGALKQQLLQLQEQLAGRVQPSPLPHPSHLVSAFSTKNKRK